MFKKRPPQKRAHSSRFTEGGGGRSHRKALEQITFPGKKKTEHELKKKGRITKHIQGNTTVAAEGKKR